MLPPYFRETIFRLIQIEAIQRFFRTRRACLDGDPLWDRDSEYLNRNKYQNPWEFSATENIIIALFAASIFSITYFLFLTPEQRTVIENLRSIYLGAPLIFVLLLWIASAPAVWVARPRDTPQAKKGMAYAVLLYHWGARGLFSKLLNVLGAIFLFIFLAIKSANGSEEVGYGWLGFLSAIMIAVSILWEYTLLFLSMIAVRKYYEPQFSYLKLLAKALLILLVIIIANSIFVGLAANLVQLSSVSADESTRIIVMGIGSVDLYELFDNEEFWILIFWFTVLFSVFYGLYSFIHSKNKLFLLRASILLGAFLPILSGCSSTPISISGVSKYVKYEENKPNIPSLSNGLVEIINDPGLIFSMDAWVIYFSYCVLALLLLSIVERRMTQLPKNLKKLVFRRDCLSLFSLLIPFVFYSLFIILLSKHPELRKYEVDINVYPKNAQIIIDKQHFKSPKKLYRGRHKLEVSLDGYKPIVGSFYVAGADRKLSFRLYKDSDSDGVWDKEDRCPNTKKHLTVGRNGCG